MCCFNILWLLLFYCCTLMRQKIKIITYLICSWLTCDMLSFMSFINLLLCNISTCITNCQTLCSLIVTNSPVLKVNVIHLLIYTRILSPHWTTGLSPPRALLPVRPVTLAIIVHLVTTFDLIYNLYFVLILFSIF